MNVVKITKESGIPLIGVIQFGIIDRRTNLIQIRPTTYCNLKCKFCSTSAGVHPVEYEVELNYLIEWVKHVIKLKECDEMEANIDSVGEPSTYPNLIELIKELNKIKEIKFISMQTNGTLLTKEKIKELEKAGLNRINMSIHSLDENTAKALADVHFYNIKKIIEIAKFIKKTKIELNLTPVYIPNINDEEIPKLIYLAKQLNCNILIQKYEVYKYSKKIKKAKDITWYNFYKKLEEWEKEFNIKLKYGHFKFNIKKTKPLEKVFEINDIIPVKIMLPGWYKNQMIASSRGRLITILDCSKSLNSKIRVKIISNDNNIYLAKTL